jgi:hypothetical protein
MASLSYRANLCGFFDAKARRDEGHEEISRQSTNLPSKQE